MGASANFQALAFVLLNNCQAVDFYTLVENLTFQTSAIIGHVFMFQAAARSDSNTCCIILFPISKRAPFVFGHANEP